MGVLKQWKVRVRESFITEQVNIVEEYGEGHFILYEVSLGWFIMRIETLNLKGKAPNSKYHFGRG